MVVADWSWQLLARCRGEDPELFFHRDTERGAQRRMRERKAQEICSSCEVLRECRRHSLQLKERFGVWGGLTEDQRYRALGLQRDRRGHGWSPAGSEGDQQRLR
ncbi:WhiB family transcriptional regulator [Mycolicibacterium septicum DSM 44393]|uniref:Transcriptional regulator WhiB n=1 Tax=Mycolicibacterium septicum DSM 44393 TaxID=1341646 RepID=A0A7X6RVQ2_9MYCO|nr:WhiB family transcriptional regulator [Mycolicibacterium septicum]NKZ10780.1 WhiB family transcriptional regulator [Mycolicibacterium septicum DSM 44393]